MSGTEVAALQDALNKLSLIAALVIVLFAGAKRIWVWGYIDTAKDKEIERLQGGLAESQRNVAELTRNFDRALTLIEERLVRDVQARRGKGP